MLNFNGNIFPLPSSLMMSRRFEEQYHCYSMAVQGRTNLEEGDKILLPPSALEDLARRSVEYPMLFELSNPAQGKRTHCGVLEFSAEEGRCYLPFWMMQNLMMGEGSLIAVRNVSLPKADFVKFQAQSVDFLEISNPKAVLERSLRKFTCVTEGDQIMITYLDKNYFLEVREVKPNGAASIIETDCNVDFDEPVGYKDSAYAKSEKKSSKEEPIVPKARTLQKAKVTDPLEEDRNGFKPFIGGAHRIDGKQVPPTSSESKEDNISQSIQAKSNNLAKESKDVTAAPKIPPRVSLIGDKYSKNKVAVSAFTGPAHKLKK